MKRKHSPTKQIPTETPSWQQDILTFWFLLPNSLSWDPSAQLRVPGLCQHSFFFQAEGENGEPQGPAALPHSTLVDESVPKCKSIP